MTRIVILFLSGLFLAAGCAVDRPPADAKTGQHQAESLLRSGVIEARPGYTGSKLGIEVEGVSVVGDELQAIDLNLPFSAEQVDSIVVESITGEVVELPREVDIEPGPDPKNTGVRIYLPKRKNWEFRIRIIDAPEDG